MKKNSKIIRTQLKTRVIEKKVKKLKNARTRVVEKKVENRRKTVKNYRKKKLKNARTRIIVEKKS